MGIGFKYLPVDWLAFASGFDPRPSLVAVAMGLAVSRGFVPPEINPFSIGSDQARDRVRAHELPFDHHIGVSRLDARQSRDDEHACIRLL